jgi:hypothetical protein
MGSPAQRPSCTRMVNNVLKLTSFPAGLIQLPRRIGRPCKHLGYFLRWCAPETDFIIGENSENFLKLCELF